MSCFRGRATNEGRLTTPNRVPGQGVIIAMGAGVIAKILMALALTASTADADTASHVRTAALEPPGLAPELPEQSTGPRRALDASLDASLAATLASDASEDRGMMISSALTVPARRVEASTRIIPSKGALISVDAGLTDRLQLSADAGERFDERTTTFSVGLKVALLERSTWQLAGQATYRRISLDGGDFIDDVNAPSGSLIATSCIDRNCVARGSLGAGLIVPDKAVRHDNVLLRTSAFFNGGIVVGAGSERLLVEASWIGDGVLAFAGVRYATGRFSIDGGLGLAGNHLGVSAAPMLGVGVRI